MSTGNRVFLFVLVVQFSAANAATGNSWYSYQPSAEAQQQQQQQPQQQYQYWQPSQLQYWQQIWQQYLNQAQQQPPATTPQPTTTTTKTTTTASPVSSGCGISGISQRLVSRIVGGFPASTNEFPWQAAVQRSDNAFCGGVIIDSWHVLTAAHCVRAGTTFRIGVGSTSLRMALSQSVDVSRVTVHPNFDSSTLMNDVAILTLSKPLDLSNPAIGAVCLPSSTDNVNNFNMCEVSGWGATSADISTLTNNLQGVTVPIVSDAECTRRYSSNFGLERFCAGDIISGGRDSCQGDSGGPLVCLSNGRYTLYGLVSSGISCARAQYPGIYAELTTYVSWIRQNL